MPLVNFSSSQILDTDLVLNRVPVTESLRLYGISIEFILFALMLLGVAILHRHTLFVALTGLLLITGYKQFFTSHDLGAHLLGGAHEPGEWPLN